MNDFNSCQRYHAEVATLRAAAQSDPGRLSDLAAALTNLSACLSEQGRSYEALPVSQEAVTCYRVVVAKDESHLRGYAIALRNLALDLDKSGRPGEALAAITDSVSIRERLTHVDNTAENHAAWAESLRNRGHFLGDAQKHHEAVMSLEQAAKLMQGLVQAGHGNYLEDVAHFEHSLAIGMHDLADATGEEMTLMKAETRAGNAVRILRGLYRKDRTLAEDLAGALYTLGAIQGDLGSERDSRKSIKEADRLSAGA